MRGAVRRRAWLGWALAPLLADPLRAQQPAAFPTRPLRLLVPYAAGGIADLSARALALHLGPLLGQAVVIDNKPGAGGVVAADTVAKAEPDGHTLLLLSNGNAVSASLFNKLPFDVARDFAPVSTLGYFDMALLTAASSPLRSLDGLRAQAKAQPGRLNLGTVALGSTQHLAAELLRLRAGLDVQLVPFNGTPAVLNALRAGQIDLALEIVGPAMPQLAAGALRALALTGPQRDAALPQVPTLVESGLPGLTLTSWNALAAPARTPAPVRERLHQAMVQALGRAPLQQQLRLLHVRPQASSPAEAAALLHAELLRWRELIAQAGIAKQ